MEKIITKFYRGKLVIKLITYVCLISSISIVVSSVLYALKHFGLINLYDITYVYGVEFFGLSFVTVFLCGYLVFRKNFCDWSKKSWYILALYHLTFFVNKYIFDIGEVGLIILNITLLVLTYLTFKSLIKNTLKKLKKWKLSYTSQP